jgi:hypothetical protein
LGDFIHLIGEFGFQRKDWGSGEQHVDGKVGAQASPWVPEAGLYPILHCLARICRGVKIVRDSLDMFDGHTKLAIIERPPTIARLGQIILAADARGFGALMVLDKL